MKKKVTLLALAAVFLLAAGNLFAQDIIVGVWKNIDDKTGKAKSHIQIFEKDGKVYGKIIKLLNDKPDAKCDKCEGDKKDKPVVGMEFVTKMKNKGKNNYAGGKILDPGNGKEYTCKMKLLDDGRLRVRGYIAFFFRTQYWHRLK